MSGHTPGPWRISKYSETAVQAKDGRGVASTGGFQSSVADENPTNQANARLIAAAPDLLKAAKTMLQYYDAFVEDKTAFPGETEMYADPLRAAIAKAEGQEGVTSTAPTT